MEHARTRLPEPKTKSEVGVAEVIEVIGNDRIELMIVRRLTNDWD